MQQRCRQGHPLLLNAATHFAAGSLSFRMIASSQDFAAECGAHLLPKAEARDERTL
jgi:hypothetical protein